MTSPPRIEAESCITGKRDLLQIYCMLRITKFQEHLTAGPQHACLAIDSFQSSIIVRAIHI